jgi:hypothetical protein
LRLSLRSFRQHPGFTVLATLIVALGAGANAAVFAVMRGVLLQPLPYERRPGQHVAIAPASAIAHPFGSWNVAQPQ